MSVRIEVTQKIIQQGKANNKHRHPIGLAIQHQFRPEYGNTVAFYGYYVDIWYEYPFAEGSPRRHWLPPAATDWGDRFDDKEAVEPFEFELTEKSTRAPK